MRPTAPKPAPAHKMHRHVMSAAQVLKQHGDHVAYVMYQTCMAGPSSLYGRMLTGFTAGFVAGNGAARFKLSAAAL